MKDAKNRDQSNYGLFWANAKRHIRSVQNEKQQALNQENPENLIPNKTNFSDFSSGIFIFTTKIGFSAHFTLRNQNKHVRLPPQSIPVCC